MDNNRIEGAAQNMAGRVQSAVGNMTGDAKTQVEGGVRQMAGQAQQTYGEARDTVAAMGESASDQIARLSAQVESLMQDKVTPALAKAADAAEGYANEARDAVAEQMERLTTTVKQRPLTAVALVALMGFVLGRITAPAPRPYRR